MSKKGIKRSNGSVKNVFFLWRLFVFLEPVICLPWADLIHVPWPNICALLKLLFHGPRKPSCPSILLLPLITFWVKSKIRDGLVPVLLGQNAIDPANLGSDVGIDTGDVFLATAYPPSDDASLEMPRKKWKCGETGQDLFIFRSHLNYSAWVIFFGTDKWATSVTLARVFALFPAGADKRLVKFEPPSQSGLSQVCLALFERYDREVDLFQDHLVLSLLAWNQCVAFWKSQHLDIFTALLAYRKCPFPSPSPSIARHWTPRPSVAGRRCQCASRARNPRQSESLQSRPSDFSDWKLDGRKFWMHYGPRNRKALWWTGCPTPHTWSSWSRDPAWNRGARKNDRNARNKKTVWLVYFLAQWAAVRTAPGAMRDPPQVYMLIQFLPIFFMVRMAHMCGHSPNWDSPSA